MWTQAHLLIFHMYLRCRRLSTYEYILEGRRKREEEEEAKEEEAITQGQVSLPSFLFFFRSFLFLFVFVSHISEFYNILHLL